MHLFFDRVEGHELGCSSVNGDAAHVVVSGTANDAHCRAEKFVLHENDGISRDVVPAAVKL